MFTKQIKLSLKLKRLLTVSFVLSAVGLLSTITGCSSFGPPLETVESVDLKRYEGTWYEIARYPHFFEQGCAGVTAEYAIRDDGLVNVVNNCYEGSLDGELRTIEGTARAVDSSNAKLKVSFFWPFEGDYWIIELGEDYDYAVVGEPGRNFLWILSRTPQMDETLLDGILERLPERGFDPERLEWVEQ